MCEKGEKLAMKKIKDDVLVEKENKVVKIQQELKRSPKKSGEKVAPGKDEKQNTRFRGRSKSSSSSSSESSSSSSESSSKSSSSESQSGSVASSSYLEKKKKSDSLSLEPSPELISNSWESTPPKNHGKSRSPSRRKSSPSHKSSSRPRIINPFGNPRITRSPSRRRSPQRVFNSWRSRAPAKGRQKSRSPLRSRSPQRIVRRWRSRTPAENRQKSRSPLGNRSPQRFYKRWRSRTPPGNFQKSRSPLRSRSPQRVFDSCRSKMPTENREKSRSPLKSLVCNPWKRILCPADREHNESELYRQRHKISLASCDPRRAPKPVQNFHRSGFDENIIRRLELRGFESPTPIQAQSWPVAQSGSNLVMVSGTGTGKTLGYLLPGIMKVQKMHLSQRRNDGPIVLVLVDCREAAILVHKEAQSFTNQHELRSQCISGSVWWNASTNCELLVLTAGRLLEIMSGDGQEMALGRCSYVVLDDIDRMIDVGLEGQLCRLLCLMRPQAQFVISSSSWPRNLQRMARKYMGNYTLIRVGDPDDSSQGLLSLRQRVVVLNSSRKTHQLKEELTAIYDLSDTPGKVVVYAERQRCVDELVAFIQVFVPCAGLHGGRTVAERDAIIRAFRNGHYNIIVVTDMTQRGLDVPGIKYVINYDLPNSVEGYVQRLTRTGCLSVSQGCEVISFFTRTNFKLSNTLVAFLEEHKQVVEPHLLQMAKDRVRRIQNRRSDRPRRGNHANRHH
nr:putative ATP-dependent RNA helicase CG14443 [Drosophila suzukii]